MIAHRPFIARLMIGLLILGTLALAGCKQSLYSNLSEREANEALAALYRAGIVADKVSAKDKTWGLQVESGELPAAVEVMNRAGLPRQRFVNLGDLFKREGIVSTPTEERVRFLHGIKQELAETLSIIDGVTDARVHLVVPDNDPLADDALPSSASVFLKHRADLNLEPLLPSIKSLVLRSVEGLTYETVFVSLVPADPVAVNNAPPPTVPLLGLSVSSLWSDWINAAVVGIIALLLAGIYFLFSRSRTSQQSAVAPTSRTNNASSPSAVNDPHLFPAQAVNQRTRNET